MISLAKDFKTPGADLDNIVTLREVAEADDLLARIKKAKKVRPQPEMIRAVLPCNACIKVPSCTAAPFQC